MKVELIKSGNTNCYLVNTGNQNILIDAGTTADCNFLKKFETKISISQIDLVVLTHGHYDHVGYAPILQKEYVVKVAIHKKDVEMIANASMDFPKAKGIFSTLIRQQTLSTIEKAKYTAFLPDVVIETDILTDYEEEQLFTNDRHFAGEEADDKSFFVAGMEITPKLLADAIHALPEEKRDAVLLYYFFDMSDPEIAKLLNLSRSTVQYRRTSSIELLKRYLEERAYENEQ